MDSIDNKSNEIIFNTCILYDTLNFFARNIQLEPTNIEDSITNNTIILRYFIDKHRNKMEPNKHIFEHMHPFIDIYNS